MKTKSLALLLVGLSVGCFHHRNRWPPRDPSIRMPDHEAIRRGPPIDGPTLRALQLAADDFFPAWGPLRACVDTPEAHTYHAVRYDEIIYVAISQDPGYCGRSYAALDSGARYAISVEGRILQRLLDGEPEPDVPGEDVEEGDSETAVLDGGTQTIDVTVPPGTQTGFPLSVDGGSSSPDGGPRE